MKILFVIHMTDKYIGGSKISAIDTANKMADSGHDVFVIADENNFTVKELLGDNVNLVHYRHNQFWPLTKGWFVYSTISKYSIKKIITIDRQSAYISSFSSFYKKIPIVPIIPGGGKDQLPIEPIKTHTIVFSAENKQNLIELFNWPEYLIEVVPARIDVSKFNSNKKLVDRENKIAFISRVNFTKRKSFIHFLNELKEMNNNNNLLDKVDVVGDGDDLVKWKEMAKSMNIKISFIGQKKINGRFLSEYKYVVGQGRVILEAISSGCVALICGNEGYKGLVNENNFIDFSKTNFTGRLVFSESNLQYDVKTPIVNTEELYSVVYNNYDIHILSKELIDKGTIVKFPEILVSVFNILKYKLLNIVRG